MIARQKAADRKRSTDNATKSGRQLSNDTGELITTHKPMAETEDFSSNEWVEITNEMIKNIGFQGKRYQKYRQSVFRHVRKQFKKNKDYRMTQVGGRNKMMLEMKQASYDKLLLNTHKLREAREPVRCFVYIMHNPIFQYYGPNVYKVGYSNDPMRRKNDDSTILLEDSSIVYQREVPSKSYERKVHKLLGNYRMKKTKEFFDCPINVIKTAIEYAIEN